MAIQREENIGTKVTPDRIPYASIFPNWADLLEVKSKLDGHTAIESSLDGQISADELIFMIRERLSSVLGSPVALYETDRTGAGCSTFVSHSRALVSQIEGLINENGDINSMDDRREFCKKVRKEINRYFRRIRRELASERPNRRARLTRIKNRFIAEQKALGKVLDSQFSIPTRVLSLHPFEAVLIDLDQYLPKDSMDRIRFFKSILEKLEGLELDHLYLEIEDLFASPDSYPDLCVNFEDTKCVDQFRRAFALVDVLVDLRDVQLPRFIAQTADEFVLSLELEMEQEYRKRLITMWSAEETLEVPSCEWPLYPFESELPPYVVSEVEADKPRYKVSRADVYRLVTYLAKGNTPLRIAKNNMRRKHSSCVEWSEDHFQFPAALIQLASEVYNCPFAGAKRMIYVRFYVRNWLEANFADHQADFHPDVFEALMEWSASDGFPEESKVSAKAVAAIDAYLAEPELRDEELPLSLAMGRTGADLIAVIETDDRIFGSAFIDDAPIEETPEEVLQWASGDIQEVLELMGEPVVNEERETEPQFEITMRDVARLLRMMVWNRETTTKRMLINMNRGHIREGSFVWAEEHLKLPEKLISFMRAVFNHPKTKGQIAYLQFYVALWLESYAHWFKDEFHPDVYRILRSGSVDAGIKANDTWMGEKNGFNEARLIAIENDLPWA